MKQEVQEEIVREKDECLWTHGPAADPHWAQREEARMRDTFMLQAAEAGFHVLSLYIDILAPT